MPAQPTVSIHPFDDQGILLVFIEEPIVAVDHYVIKKSVAGIEGGRFLIVKNDLAPDLAVVEGIGTGIIYRDANVPSGAVVSYMVGAVDGAGTYSYSHIATGQITLSSFAIHIVPQRDATQVHFFDSIAYREVRSRELHVSYFADKAAPDVSPGRIVDRVATYQLVLHGATIAVQLDLLREILNEHRVVCARDPIHPLIFGVLKQFEPVSDDGLIYRIDLQIKGYPYSEEVF